MIRYRSTRSRRGVMRQRVRTLLAGGLLAASAMACSGPAPMGEPDASVEEADSGFIGGTLDSGIGLLFAPDPSLGESFSHDGNTMSVRTAEFTLANLRLIGDAASGDSGTSKDLVELNWVTDRPIGVAFDDAPPGMYSNVRGTVVGFAIYGDVEVDGAESVPFEIEQESSSLPFEFTLNLDLEAGEAQTVDVIVDLQTIVEEIPFDELDIEDGSLEVESDSEAMAKVQEKISEAFDAR